MREDFVEPMPALKTSATLIFGKDRVNCFVIDANLEEFVVAIPNAEHYEGDPRLMLVTGDAIHPVHLVLQEARAGGYTYRLKRITTEVTTNDDGFFKKLWSSPSRLKICAGGLALSVITGVLFIATDENKHQLISMRSNRRDSSTWWSPTEQGNDQIPPGISIDKALLVKKNTKNEKQKLKRADSVEQPSGELKTVSVSMISPASMSAPALLPEDRTMVDNLNPNSDSQSHANKKNGPKLANLLHEGEIGRQRTLTPELIPWLFGNAPYNQLGYLKISDAACADLQQFELGLRGMPIEMCMESIESLRRTLRRSNNVNNARTVYGLDDMFVIKSEDANIYFRTRKGMVEIVRVLPIDYNTAE